jgi:hypothetical protein
VWPNTTRLHQLVNQVSSVGRPADGHQHPALSDQRDPQRLPGPEPAGDNPWNALTPEWLTSSPPPVENCDRGGAPWCSEPYGYGADPDALSLAATSGRDLLERGRIPTADPDGLPSSHAPMTSLSSTPNQRPEALGPQTCEHGAYRRPGEDHGDHRLFGLATFLVADGMTFAGLLRRLPHLSGGEPIAGRMPPTSWSCCCPPSTRCCCW